MDGFWVVSPQATPIVRRGHLDDEDAGSSISPCPGDLGGPPTGEPNVRIVITAMVNLLRSIPQAGAALSTGVAAIALAASGCGSAGGESGGAHPDYAAALRGSPPPLARLHAQGNRLLDGGVGAYEGRIAALRGYPVVVNVWASWCGPCRFEFPTLQKLSARYGKRVAFLGINSQDSDDAARTFLSEDPVPYPSYTDPDKDVARSIGADLGLPDTAFYDRHGELVNLKQGPYSDPGELQSDIERYALEGG
jgi:thiol-disulfide isomerase/thioredoxin